MMPEQTTATLFFDCIDIWWARRTHHPAPPREDVKVSVPDSHHLRYVEPEVF